MIRRGRERSEGRERKEERDGGRKNCRDNY